MISIAIAWLLADLITGIIHWFEDKCLDDTSRSPLIRGIALDNIKHHKQPQAVCDVSYWYNIDTTAPFTIPLSMVLWLIGAHTILWLAVFFATFANIVHRWAHDKPSRVPRVVRWLQGIGVFVSPQHHSIHHYRARRLVSKDEASRHYCVMTNFLNPMLDSVDFFGRLERIFGVGGNK